MKIKNWVLGIIVLVFIFGGIGIATASGRWQTENTKTPARYATGDFAGESIPADIRGSYTFGDISDAWEIPVDTLAAAFGIDAEYAAAFRCGELESIYAGLPEEVEIRVYKRYSGRYETLEPTLPFSQLERQPIILPRKT